MLWLCTGFPQFWSFLLWALVVHRLPLVLVLPLLVCGCVQDSPILGIFFLAVAMLRLPSVWSCICLAVDVHRLTLVLVLALLGCDFAQASPGLGLAYARMWLCTGFLQSLSCLC